MPNDCASLQREGRREKEREDRKRRVRDRQTDGDRGTDHR